MLYNVYFRTWILRKYAISEINLPYDDRLLLFRRLCKYYFSINTLVTAQYINYYREQNNP